MPIDTLKILVNFVPFKNDEQVTKKIADNEKKIEVLTELVAQYQLNELKFTKFVIKKQITDVLKSVDVKYLPYDLHSKYYLLCYAHNFKPKITFVNAVNHADGRDAGQNDPLGMRNMRSMSLHTIKQKWGGFVEDIILWFYKKYLYHILLSILVMLIIIWPKYAVPTMIILTM